MTTRHKFTLLVLSSLVLATMIVPAALAWSDLPASIATHWDLGGTPNGHMSPTMLLVLMVGIFTAVGFAVWYSARRMPFEARSFITGLAWIGGLLAAVTWFSVDLNRGVADWAQARALTAVHLVVTLVAAFGLGAVAWFTAGPTDATRDPVGAADGPLLRVAAGEHPVWSAGGRGPVLIVIGLLMLAIAFAVWSLLSLMFLAIGLLIMVFAEVRATVSERGVVVSMGWLGIPHWLVPLSDITGAVVEDVSPMAYGGWGYRVRPGARAVVVRGGPSLRLHRSNRPDLVLTVDDAERGAGLVNGLLARR